MKSRMIEHALSILFVTIIMVSLIIFFSSTQKNECKKNANTNSEIIPESINLGDNFDKALLIDVLNIFYPDQYDKNISTVENISIKRETDFTKKMSDASRKKRLSFSVIINLLIMYLKFLFVYAIVMTLTYYAVISAGVWRFVRKRGKCEIYASKKSKGILEIPLFLIRKFIKLIIHMILFSPAFVIAYSMKTDLNTDSMPFMILLGVISNGLLIIYTNKFYVFLVAESRKGYVDTAIVKNMKSSYIFNSSDGISLKMIFYPIKNFNGHVFDHIYKNAIMQYASTLKEQAAFLITGLIIIEMALNIHGYLNYEMLKEILYGNKTIVIFIILLLFYTAKITEIMADLVIEFQQKKYRN